MTNKYVGAAKFIKNLITGGKKSITPGGAINKVPTNVPTTVIQKKIRDLKIGNQKLKSGQAKLDQAIFNLQEQNRAFKKNKKVTEKKDGGRIGLKRGTGLTKKKSNTDKIKKTFGSKSLGMQSVIYGLDKNKNVTKADPKAKFIAAAKKKTKKKVI
mgnify:CR=1 FL=1